MSLSALDLDRARRVACAVPDPELPMLDIGDLGLVREVRADGEAVVVVFTPTYSGCPATEPIQQDILRALADAGFEGARIEVRRSPAWSTDWIRPSGRQKLRAAGIAPPAWTPPAERGAPAAALGLGRKVPGERSGGSGPTKATPEAWPDAGRSTPAARDAHPAALPVFGERRVDCPLCGSARTERLAEHGSTPCKALYRCLDCREPFDCFKCH